MHSALVLRFAILTVIATPMSAAHAASFNCAKAVSLRERTVCATPALSKLDDQLAAAYTSTRGQLSPVAADLIQSDQRAWLKRLDDLCPPDAPKTSNEADTPACLSSRYSERLTQLTANVQHIGDITFFPRYQIIVVPGDKSEPETPADPGYGDGAFLWPQIDNPTPSQQAWNQAVYHRLITLSGNKDSTDLDSAVDATGFIDTSYQVTAVGPTLINLDLTVMTYGWGAAHPLTSTTSFAWWLDKQRPLTLADLFRADSHWQTGLVPVVIARLNQDPDRKGSYWRIEERSKAVASAIANPSAWSISKKDATLYFGQYEVGPYVIGMPTAHFSWKELKPFLNPDLDPTKLPPPYDPPQTAPPTKH